MRRYTSGAELNAGRRRHPAHIVFAHSARAVQAQHTFPLDTHAACTLPACHISSSAVSGAHRHSVQPSLCHSQPRRCHSKRTSQRNKFVICRASKRSLVSTPKGRDVIVRVRHCHALHTHFLRGSPTHQNGGGAVCSDHCPSAPASASPISICYNSHCVLCVQVAPLLTHSFKMSRARATSAQPSPSPAPPALDPCEQAARNRPRQASRTTSQRRSSR